MLLDKKALAEIGVTAAEPVSDRLVEAPLYLLLNHLQSIGLDWFVETIVSTGRLGDYIQLYFDGDNNPLVAYSNEAQKAIYTATRRGTTWSAWRTALADGPMSAALNERTGAADFSWLNRARTSVATLVVI